MIYIDIYRYRCISQQYMNTYNYKYVYMWELTYCKCSIWNIDMYENTRQNIKH